MSPPRVSVAGRHLQHPLSAFATTFIPSTLTLPVALSLFLVAAALGPALLIVPAAGAADEAADARPLAVIGDRPITVDRFKAEMERRAGGSPDAFADPKRREALLDDLVRFELLHAAALKGGYEKKPEVVEGIRRFLVNRFLEEELAPRLAAVTTTEEEVAAYYRDHTKDFATPKKVRGAVIHVAVPAKASDEARARRRERILAARQEALALPPSHPTFGGVAATWSDDQATRYRGGDTGLMAVGAESRWPPEVTESLFGLEPGQVGEVLETPAGFWLVKLSEVTESAVRSLDEVREAVVYRLLAEKKRAVELAFIEELRKAAGVSIDRDLLEKVVPPAGVVPVPPSLPGQ